MVLLIYSVPVLPAATAAATTTATAATAATAWLTLLCLIDLEVAAVQILAVQILDSSLGVTFARHLGEGKTARSTGVPVHHHVYVLHATAILFQRVAKGVFVSIERKVSDVESRSHLVVSFAVSAISYQSKQRIGSGTRNISLRVMKYATAIGDSN